ncbi:MBL fold metallo-hydrolase [Pedobacter sp. Leaf216]|uniref:MBL fold metallo-hydrolase n=1 Tax=Pedobacter sp. Leaf216 TaxID=1735684 RepID=UPI0006F8586F|nr:MBL fold metallo-hydrolase [Pedobacter sp. Leaf216]KQM79137.1 MBL fold metallo-hydrolase [Pedobacter sp. Leaf216]
MITIKTFTFNAYSENTYVLYDESKECIIIDPGMYEGVEQNELAAFIKQQNLIPVLLLNTHCHLDHVFGNKFVFETYGLKPQFHEGELPVLTAVPGYAPSMGFNNYQISPLPDTFLPETGTVSFGNSTLSLIFAPGHSPAHLCFYSEADHILMGGDVLFYGSIGRSDLPGGNHQQLIQNISDKLFVLPDETVVYPGHGPATSIGFEKQNNPFF